jgi:two-component system sensor histidine kinase EvgS
MSDSIRGAVQNPLLAGFRVAGIVILTSLIWIYYLRREIGARQLAQQDLQSQLAYNETLTRALSEETERAEQANRAKSTFLATMSHEIRTPVSAIIGLLELTVNAADKTWEDDDPVRVACESARSLMGLIGDILDMARIESGRLELTPQWVRTADLLPPWCGSLRAWRGRKRYVCNMWCLQSCQRRFSRSAAVQTGALKPGE